MESILKTEVIQTLHQKNICLFTVNDAKKIFNIHKENTLYKFLQRLEKSGIITRIAQGKYLFFLKQVHDFDLANFLIDPSYVSLESALSFYGILPQFPYSITSVTPIKSKKIIATEKEFEYAHLEKKYFFSFIKKNNFLIATPEKALIDQLYFAAKKLRSLHFDDLDLTSIDRKKIKKISRQYNFIPLQNLLIKYKLC